MGSNGIHGLKSEHFTQWENSCDAIKQKCQVFPYVFLLWLNQNQTRNNDRMVSFEQLHSLPGRATPSKMAMYKHALLLHRTINDQTGGKDWADLNCNHIFNERNPTFNVVDVSRLKIGRNQICNRLKCLNSKINQADLSYISFKLRTKTIFFN